MVTWLVRGFAIFTFIPAVCADVGCNGTNCSNSTEMNVTNMTTVVGAVNSTEAARNITTTTTTATTITEDLTKTEVKTSITFDREIVSKEEKEQIRDVCCSLVATNVEGELQSCEMLEKDSSFHTNKEPEPPTCETALVLFESKKCERGCYNTSCANVNDDLQSLCTKSSAKATADKYVSQYESCMNMTGNVRRLLAAQTFQIVALFTGFIALDGVKLIQSLQAEPTLTQLNGNKSLSAANIATTVQQPEPEEPTSIGPLRSIGVGCGSKACLYVYYHIGSSVKTFLESPKYPSLPDLAKTLTSLRVPPYDRPFGAMLETWITAPVSGSYVFITNSTGNSEVWVGPNTGSIKGLQKAVEVELVGCCNETVTGTKRFELAQGSTYYLKGLVVEGALSVGMQRVGDEAYFPLEDEYLTAGTWAARNSSDRWCEKGNSDQYTRGDWTEDTSWLLTQQYGWRWCDITATQCKKRCVALGSCREIYYTQNGCCFPSKKRCTGTEAPGGLGWNPAGKYVYSLSTLLFGGEVTDGSGETDKEKESTANKKKKNSDDSQEAKSMDTSEVDLIVGIVVISTVLVVIFTLVAHYKYRMFRKSSYPVHPNPDLETPVQKKRYSFGEVVSDRMKYLAALEDKALVGDKEAMVQLEQQLAELKSELHAIHPDWEEARLDAELSGRMQDAHTKQNKVNKAMEEEKQERRKQMLLRKEKRRMQITGELPPIPKVNKLPASPRKLAKAASKSMKEIVIKNMDSLLRLRRAALKGDQEAREALEAEVEELKSQLATVKRKKTRFERDDTEVLEKEVAAVTAVYEKEMKKIEKVLKTNKEKQLDALQRRQEKRKLRRDAIMERARVPA